MLIGVFVPLVIHALILSLRIFILVDRARERLTLSLAQLVKGNDTIIEATDQYQIAIDFDNS